MRSVANALVTTPSPRNTHALTKPQNGKNHPLGRLEPPKRTASRTSTFNVQLCPSLGGWPDRTFFSEHTSQFCLDIREEDNRCSWGISDHSIHDDLPQIHAGPTHRRRLALQGRRFTSFYFKDSLAAFQLLLQISHAAVVPQISDSESAISPI